MTLVVPPFGIERSSGAFAAQEFAEALDSTQTAWAFLAGFVTEQTILDGVHEDAQRLRRDIPSLVHDSGNNFGIMEIPRVALVHCNPTKLVLGTFENIFVRRLNHAQFSFYPPGTEVSAHAHEANSSIHSVVLGVAGEGISEIHPDTELGFTDHATLPMNASDVSVLPPIKVKRKSYTTRRHSARNTGTVERVVLVASFL